MLAFTGLPPCIGGMHAWIFRACDESPASVAVPGCVGTDSYDVSRAQAVESMRVAADDVHPSNVGRGSGKALNCTCGVLCGYSRLRLQ